MHQVGSIILAGSSPVLTTKKHLETLVYLMLHKMFRKSYPQLDIQHKNPTLLYFPNSLDLKKLNLQE